MKTTSRLLIFLSLFTVLSAERCSTVGPHHKWMSTEYQFSGGNEKEWATVDSLEQQGLYRSALEAVEAIYVHAAMEKDVNEQVKAMFYELKFASFIEEEALFKSIDQMEGIAASSTAYYPLKPIVHSILAESYWGYYQSHRYQFMNRTQTVDYDARDFNTWSLEQILGKVYFHYGASLEGYDQLKRTPVDSITPLLIDQHSDRFTRPKLFDLLAHRALGFYKNAETGLTAPAYKFQLKGARYFSLFEEFAYMRIRSKDTVSTEYQALKVFQQLTRAHLADNDPEAMGPLELERLRFVYDHSIHPAKDSLYLDALEKLTVPLREKPAWAEVQHAIATYWETQGRKYQPLLGDEHKWELKKASEIAEAAIKKFPRSFGARNCVALLERLNAEYLSAEVEEVNAPNTPFRVSIAYRNTERINVRIYKVPDEFVEHQSLDETELKKLLKKEPDQVQFYSPPLDGDKQQHRMEVKLDVLPFGHYVLLLSSNEKFDIEKPIAHTGFWVSDLAMMTRTMDDQSMQITVLQRQTGQPLEGVTVGTYQRVYNNRHREYEWNLLRERQTDVHGRVLIPAPTDYVYFELKLTQGEDHLVPDVAFSQYNNGPRHIEQRISTHFFLDRAIYRPGQTIYFKGIVLKQGEKDPEIVPDHSETVTFYDANRQKVSELQLTTNEYGTFNGSFIAPMGGLTGGMRISSSDGTAYFRVEEYKRPRFEVELDPVEGSFKLDEDVSITGKAMSYSGAALNDAEVRYYVRREVRYPFWYWRGPWMPQPSSSGMEIKSGSVQTAADGTYQIDFQAIADKSISEDKRPVFDYHVHVDVVDMTGETHSADRNVSVGYDAMQLGIGIPGILNVQHKDSVTISAQNLNGQPVEAEGKLTIHRLQMPEQAQRARWWMRPDTFVLDQTAFKKAFPLDIYDNEADAMEWPKAEKVLDKDFTSNQKFLLKELKAWSPGKYLAEVKSTDAFGRAVTEKQLITVFDTKAKKVPEPEVFFSLPLKTIGEPGETAEVLIGSSEALTVLYEVEVMNTIVKSEWIQLNKDMRKISVPIKEEHRGNFTMHFSALKNNRTYALDHTVIVPRSDKKLDISYETFRDKLRPGSEEEWRIKIKGPGGEKVAAEMLAAMYDASLDAFAANNWNFNVFSSYYNRRAWTRHYTMNSSGTSQFSKYGTGLMGDTARVFDAMNFFGFYPYSYGRRLYSRNGNTMAYSAVPMTEEDVAFPKAEAFMDAETAAEKTTTGVFDANGEFEQDNQQRSDKAGGGEITDIPKSTEVEITARKNLQETAFFFPDLMTDAEGNVVLKFTMPEALTRWKFLGLAHSKELQYALTEKEIVTQKELMVTPNVPRFLRKGDKITLSAKVSNLSEKHLEGTIKLELFDAITNEPADQLLKNANPIRNFNAPKGQSAAEEWQITVPEKFDAITYRFTARADKFTDGEEGALPVLSNRMLVTETMPLPIRKKGTKTWRMDKLLNAGSSSTLKHHALTFEFTSNPVWYAVQALPYMMEYPHECSEQTFTRLYANSLAAHIGNSDPKIKAVFEQWKSASPESFLSALEKNQELKALVLEETPWVMEAKDQSERKKRVALLFDLQRMEREQATALRKLREAQYDNGGWPWFPGMKESRYITQHIVTGFGHMDVLGVYSVLEDPEVGPMVQNAVRYLDERVLEDYKKLDKEDRENQDYISATHVQYLYARSYFKEVSFRADVKTAFAYYKGKAEAHWLKQGLQLQAMIALSMHRWENTEKAQAIMRSLKERSLQSEEMGMYWKEFYAGYSWYQMPVETHALMIEAFDEIMNDQEAVNDLRTFLLKQKQTTDWKTTKATADACYALLLRGESWLTEAEIPVIKLGGTTVDTNDPDLKKEAGTGYFKKSWSGSAVQPEMGEVSITKQEDGVSWGALYWQYFEDLDKITPAETPLQLKKQLFIEKRGDIGPVLHPVEADTELKPGDLLKVRIELRADRNMEFVHMKDMRASGLEPINVLSQYKWQDGLGYYESTRDASTNFFMDWLPKGVYVFEYPLRVTHNGDMSNGITSIQCMYAPEFTAHSEGVRVTVGE